MNLTKLTEQKINSILNTDKLLLRLIGDIYMSHRIYLSSWEELLEVSIVAEEHLRIQCGSTIAACYRLEPSVRLNVVPSVPDNSIEWKSLIYKLERRATFERTENKKV